MKFLSKNGILIMVIVIILLISVITMYIKHAENFSETGSSDKCDWDPYGETEFKCISSCTEKGDLYGCDAKSCVKACQECNNSEKCKWLKNPKVIAHIENNLQ